MFGWLKRKRSNEQKKLLYQNGFAANALRGYFEFGGDMTTVSILQELEEENRRIALSVPEGHFVSPDDTEILLNMNKELRRLFDQTATRYVDTFDNTYKPPLGWDQYYRRDEIFKREEREKKSLIVAIQTREKGPF